jgi:hypothetical protein
MKPMRNVTPSGQKALREALAGEGTLAALLRRLEESRARLAAATAALPAELAPLVQPGPLDDAAWVLLVPHNAAAAKLRHALPEVAGALAAAGFAPRELKVKVRRPR